MSISGVDNYTSPVTRTTAPVRPATENLENAQSFEEEIPSPPASKYLKLDAWDEYGRQIAKPTADNMEQLSRNLAQRMKEAFAKAGLSEHPSVTLRVENGEIKAEGRRGDLEQIEEALNSDPDIVKEAGQLSFITEVMYSFVKDGHMAFQREYAMTNGSSATVSKYGHLFNNGPKAPRDTAINFGAGGLSTTCEGQTVSAADFRNNPDWVEEGQSTSAAASASCLAERQQSALIGSLVLRSKLT